MSAQSIAAQEKTLHNILRRNIINRSALPFTSNYPIFLTDWNVDANSACFLMSLPALMRLAHLSYCKASDPDTL